MKKWFVVIGDPIAHSKSPQMHNTWFAELNINATYIPIHVQAQDLSRAVESLRLLGASGFNVTIPHKEAILPLLDELDPMAQKMGAVNTVVRLADGRFKGYNTDGVGFVRSLEAQIGTTHRKDAVLLIGAGGAARGIAFAMQQAGYDHITICNRTVARAEALVQELNMGTAISLQQAELDLANYNIVIQVTSAGLNQNFALPFALTHLQRGTVVADIVYNPLITPFLAEAKHKEATIVTGVGMFVHQGAIAFEHWLQQQPDTNLMIATISGN